MIIEYVIAGLAVYKALHLIRALTTALLSIDLLPWMFVVLGVVLGYVASVTLVTPNPWIDGLAIAALASGWHTLIRSLWLRGDSSILSSIQNTRPK